LGTADVPRPEPFRVTSLAGKIWWEEARSPLTAASRNAPMEFSPFEQGLAAATDGLPASVNPYAEGTTENAAWSEGYHSILDDRDDIEAAEPR